MLVAPFVRSLLRLTRVRLDLRLVDSFGRFRELVLSYVRKVPRVRADVFSSRCRLGRELIVDLIVVVIVGLVALSSELIGLVSVGMPWDMKL